MKKIIALIMALTLTVCSVASCKKNDRTDISGAQTINDLAGAKIGAQIGTFHEEARTQIPDVKGDVYADFNSMLVALNSGAIDGYIAEEPTAKAVCKNDSSLGYIKFENNTTGFTATPADVSIAIGCKTGSPLVEQINAVLATITEDQKNQLMEQMVAINSGESIGELALSNTAETTSNGVLRVAMECAYAPYNWAQLDSTNGAVKVANDSDMYVNGYDVQIAKYVANALGMTLEIYKTEWDSLITGLNAGSFDAIIAGMSPTAEREEEIDFTSTYYTATLVVIYKKS